MENIKALLEYTTPPDLFVVAVESWGIETIGLYLIPSFFSVIILGIAFIGVLNVALYKREKIQIALVVIVGLFVITQLLRWWYVATSSESSLLWLAFLGGEVLLLALTWTFLIKLLRSFLPKITFYAFISVLFSVIASSILLKIFVESVFSETLFLVAETLLFVSFCYITIMTRRLLSIVQHT